MLRGALLISAAEIGPVRTIAATATMTPTPTMHSVSLAAIGLVVAVRRRILLWLRVASGDECGEAAQFLAAFVRALSRLRVRLLLMLRPVVNLLLAGREWLGVARQVGLLLRLTRGVARFVLAAELWLHVVVFAIKGVVATRQRRTRSLLLLIVIGVLLAKLFLRGCDQAEIMLGVLIIIFGCNRIAGTLRVARELNVLFRDMRCGAADLHVGTV